MLVSLVGALKVVHQLTERAVVERLVHEVRAPAHAQRAVASVAVDAQDHVVETVARELRLEADGEALQRRQAVGQVAGRNHVRIYLHNQICIAAYRQQSTAVGRQSCQMLPMSRHSKTTN